MAEDTFYNNIFTIIHVHPDGSTKKVDYTIPCSTLCSNSQSRNFKIYYIKEWTNAGCKPFEYNGPGVGDMQFGFDMVFGSSSSFNLTIPLVGILCNDTRGNKIGDGSNIGTGYVRYDYLSPGYTISMNMPKMLDSAGIEVRDMTPTDGLCNWQGAPAYKIIDRWWSPTPTAEDPDHKTLIIIYDKNQYSGYSMEIPYRGGFGGMGIACDTYINPGHSSEMPYTVTGPGSLVRDERFVGGQTKFSKDYGHNDWVWNESTLVYDKVWSPNVMNFGGPALSGSGVYHNVNMKPACRAPVPGTVKYGTVAIVTNPNGGHLSTGQICNGVVEILAAEGPLVISATSVDAEGYKISGMGGCVVVGNGVPDSLTGQNIISITMMRETKDQIIPIEVRIKAMLDATGEFLSNAPIIGRIINKDGTITPVSGTGEVTVDSTEGFVLQIDGCPQFKEYTMLGQISIFSYALLVGLARNGLPKPDGKQTQDVVNMFTQVKSTDTPPLFTPPVEPVSTIPGSTTDPVTPVTTTSSPTDPGPAGPPTEGCTFDGGGSDLPGEDVSVGYTSQSGLIPCFPASYGRNHVYYSPNGGVSGKVGEMKSVNVIPSTFSVNYEGTTYNYITNFAYITCVGPSGESISGHGCSLSGTTLLINLGLPSGSVITLWGDFVEGSPPVVDSGWVAIQCTVPMAVARLNGSVYPLPNVVELPVGNYSFVATCPYYEDWASVVFEIKKDETVNFMVDLIPVGFDSAPLEIITIPPSAIITLDGVPQSNLSNFTVAVQARRMHRVQADLIGYYPAYGSIMMGAKNVKRTLILRMVKI